MSFEPDKGLGLEQRKLVLAAVNWNFSTPFTVGRSGSGLFDCRKYHWYPATFVPDIPYTLIEMLTDYGEVVLDSFAGIGTTIFQALLLGRVPYGIESCRVAVEVIRSLWTALACPPDWQTMSDGLGHLAASFDARHDYAGDLDQSPTNVEKLRPWFAPTTFSQLLHIMAAEREQQHPGLRAAMRVALSATLKAVSAQDRGWGCIADNVLPSAEQLKRPRDAFERFSRNLSTLVRDVLRRRTLLSSQVLDLLASADPFGRINHCDARTARVLPDGAADIIVTSPPYPSMTDYTTSQRLSYYWLGCDPAGDLGIEIGSRRRRRKPEALQEYRDSMRQVATTISASLKPGAHACLVLPHFDTEKKETNEARQAAVHECIRLLIENGLDLDQEMTRLLPSGRRHHNQKWTTLEQERIHIFRKPP